MRLSLTASPTFAFAAPDTTRAGAASPVAEIVTFQIADGADPEAFIAAAKGMTPFLDATGAVLSRTLSVDEAGLWTDHIVWTSMASAKSAAEEMMQQPEAAPFMSLIVADTVAMRHVPIQFAMQKE
jgi:hypothetical protein